MSGLARAGKLCLNCYFFEPGAVPIATSQVHIDVFSDVGTCQRKPPVLDAEGESVWPRVNRVRTCGEWVSDQDNWWDDDGPPGDGERAPASVIKLAAVGRKRAQ